MTAKDTNYTLGEESTTWLMYTLENVLPFFMPYQLGLLTVMLYFPIIETILLIYCGSIFINTCKKIGNLPDDPDSKQWRKVQQIHAFVISMLGKLWHGYEICGMDNIPKGPAVIVFFHGGLPAGYYFFLSTFYRMTGRLCRTVSHRSFYNLPGIKTYFAMQGLGILNREECVAVLKKGHLLGIAPGGLREQNYSNNYKLIWGKRQGFAQVAIDAKVPIIPFFTQNIQEGYRVYGNTALMRWLYEQTRTVVFPICGSLPVKLRTHVGEAIPYDPNITVAELFEKTKLAVEALRDKHQKIPGSILSALWERFEVHRKEEQCE